MAVERYRISLLELDDCPLCLTPTQLSKLLKAWRKSHLYAHVCSECGKTIEFGSVPYGTCCERFYYNDRVTCYPIMSIAIPTPGYDFMLPQLKKNIEKAGIETRQDFLILSDPIYWQVPTTLTYEKMVKFVSGIPMTCRTQNIQPPEKAPLFYKQVQEAPLNYGSLNSRSCGKATLIRQVAFGKRCRYSMRGMIVPDPSLSPNEIRVPDSIVEKFQLRGKWVLLNRMPSLQPENIVGLQVPVNAPSWPFDCFGIPLEIVRAINGDFDGDEVNIYLVPGIQSQAECATIMNPEWEMGCFVMGLKLNPTQDMLVAYYLFYDEIDFLPYKNPDLKKTFRVIYDLYGSKRTFRAFDDMRKFYLDVLQNRICFALSLHELVSITEKIRNGQDLKTGGGCLVTQILSGAGGSFEHLHQMFGEENSFWYGLKPLEAMTHAKTTYEALSKSAKIWLPGYGYSKLVYNLHGMKVDYLGRLMDGKERIVEKDALDAFHYTDAMSAETFDYILDQVLVKRNFGELLK